MVNAQEKGLLTFLEIISLLCQFLVVVILNYGDREKFSELPFSVNDNMERATPRFCEKYNRHKKNYSKSKACCWFESSLLPLIYK